MKPMLQREGCFFVGFLFSLSPGCAHAPVEEQAFASYGSAALTGCIDKTKGTTSELLGCSADEWERQNFNLDATYREIANTIDPSERRVLDQSQKNWLTRRNRICEAYLEGRPGTLEWLLYKSCFPGETEKRVKWLRRRYLAAN